MVNLLLQTFVIKLKTMILFQTYNKENGHGEKMVEAGHPRGSRGTTTKSVEIQHLATRGSLILKGWRISTQIKCQLTFKGFYQQIARFSFE